MVRYQYFQHLTLEGEVELAPVERIIRIGIVGTTDERRKKNRLRPYRRVLFICRVHNTKETSSISQKLKLISEKRVEKITSSDRYPGT